VARPEGIVSEPANQQYTVGAQPDCDIVVAQPQVSGRHARLSMAGRVYILEDLGSTNGTFVDGSKIQRCAVTGASRIGLGSFQTDLDTLLKLASQGREAQSPHSPAPQPPLRPVAPEAAELVRVGASMLIIGRDSVCDICISEAAVSGRHARVFRNCGRIVVEDIGSANGTFIRGERISWWVLRPEDVVQIGSRTFRFEREETSARQTVTGARIDLRGVGIDVHDQATGQPLRIIHNVSFTALPGEIVGVMGRSGSGKTTLLRVLAGISAPTAGDVLLDGESLHSPAGNIRSELAPLVGFAPQDDIVHELLTVEEAVRYSARLRCAAHVSGAEIERRVSKALEDVGLEDKRHTRIGSATAKSLSGGQRKRVSIAMELVTDPPLLLLDEPTSGLSSRDAADLMALLRRLADEGRTVILTIHQPSYPMFVQMDQIVLLDNGQLAYFGPSAVDVFEFFDVRERQAGAVFDRLAEGEERRLTPTWPERYSTSKLYERTVAARAQTLPSFAAPQRRAQKPRGALTTLAVLIRRGLAMKARDKFFWVVAILVPLLASSLITLVIKTQLGEEGGNWFPRAAVAHTYLVVLTIMVCFFGALSTSLEILYERAVFGRERRSGLRLVPYVGSKALMYLIPAILHPAMSLLIFLGLGGALEGNFPGYYLVLVPAFWAAACAGLCLSALMRSAEGVVGLAVAYAIVQTVFSAFAPLHVSYGKDARHAWLKWAANPVTARWTLNGLVTRSDLCSKGDKAVTEATTAEARASASASVTQCQRSFYLDHGAYPAEYSDDRVKNSYFNRAIAANSILAAVALIGTGLVLRRRRN
jgi:ABC transport system ATP-binding/permease protein